MLDYFWLLIGGAGSLPILLIKLVGCQFETDDLHSVTAGKRQALLASNAVTYMTNSPPQTGSPPV